MASVALMATASGGAYAQGHPGGGAHFAGGGAPHGVVGHGSYGYGGGYHGGYRGGYYGYGGYRGYGGYGWRGGYYGGWGWGGWGGLGVGLYFASLPLYYSTLWWGGIPYYYADHTYYVYDGNAGQYQTVAPPAGLAATQEPAAAAVDLIAYPKNGQSTEQQGKDRYECHRWAATQTGFDPTLGTPTAAVAGKRGDYVRAQAACLEGRGYSVK